MMPETKRLLFCANWKMQVAPGEAREFLTRFRAAYLPTPHRHTWFFPSAVSIEAVAGAIQGLPNARVGAQDVHWEPKGAFTGATSVPLAQAAGATAALIGHSERRRLFGETDADTARKVRAALSGGLVAVLCVGETLEQRERGQTTAVVARQLGAGVEGLSAAEFDRMVVAYEPVWAIGTGRNATPRDAATVHSGIRSALIDRGATNPWILYGGSVSQNNVAALLAEAEIEGVLVGGASLTPDGWAGICSTGA